jgi:glycosidase
MSKNTISSLLILSVTLVFTACSQSDNKTTENDTNEPHWSEQAVIYEVNLRHATNEGTINAFVDQHLTRLENLGVDILWIMPIHPVGEKNRKAKGDLFVEDIEDESERKRYLGSPYAVKNYTAVNPDYGTLSDFQTLVTKAHDKGMKVIIDWVANHSAWDNPWVESHPEWYTKKDGEITDPLDGEGNSIGWTDVADFDYSQKELWDTMKHSMAFWVEQADIDGFRCDVAMEVPAEFWQAAASHLNDIKPMFMLAESEEHNMELFNNAFNAYYGWEMHHVMNEIAAGNESAQKVVETQVHKDSIFGDKAFPMHFITNHDENSWNGTVFERMPDHFKRMAVLSYTLPGMPLIYTGQEVGLSHRMKFFEKDSVNWSADSAGYYTNFYAQLNELKEKESALGVHSPIRFQESNEDQLIFDRGKDGSIRVILLFDADPMDISSYLTEYDVVFGKVDENSTLDGNGFVILKKTPAHS